MCDRGYPGYLFGGTPVSSWDRGFNSLENQIQQQYRGRNSSGRYWGSMSEGGGISAAGGDSCKTNLIVNYLPQTMTEKDLYAMFMAIGPIESCRVMKDFKTGYSYGFGFVNFTREEDASRAIDTFNGYQLRNKRLKVSYARPSGDDIKDTNLYVTNLPRAITEDQLQTIFGKYGRIVQKHILRDKSSGTPRGVAFVRFDKREEAQEAIAALNNVIPEGGTEPLSVKVAEEHGKQKAAYYAGWAAGFNHNRGKAPLGEPSFQYDIDNDPLERPGVENELGNAPFEGPWFENDMDNAPLIKPMFMNDMNSGLLRKPRFMNNGPVGKPRFMNNAPVGKPRFMNNTNKVPLGKPRFMNNAPLGKPRFMNYTNNAPVGKPRFMNRTNNAPPGQPRFMNHMNNAMKRFTPY